jgi:hypothetical protein
MLTAPTLLQLVKDPNVLHWSVPGLLKPGDISVAIVCGMRWNELILQSSKACTLSA